MDKEYHPSNNINNTSHSGCTVNVESQNNTIIIELAGEIDLGSSSRIYSLILQQCKQADIAVIINLENIVFMDSSGLQILLRLREKLDHYHQHILLVKPRPQIKKLFQLTAFDKMFHIFADQEQAFAYLAYEERQNKKT